MDTRLAPSLLAALLVACSGGSFWQPTPEPTPDGQGPQAQGPPPTLDLESTGHRHGALRISRHFYPDPYSVSGNAGGPVDPSYLGRTVTGPCVGFTEAVPSHRLTLNEDFEYLRLEVQAQADTTLLLQGATGWLCNDDGDAANPRIEARLAAGTYRLWVGSASGISPPAPYTLLLSEQSLAADEEPPVAEPPDDEPPPDTAFELDPTEHAARFGPVGLSPGFRPDPVEVGGSTGGPVDAGYLGYTATGECSGQTTEAPGHLLTLHADFDYLRLEALAERSVGLVVYGPEGWLCNEGEAPSDPFMDGYFPAGQYRVWVTDQDTYGRPDYTLTFTQVADADADADADFGGPALGELDRSSPYGRFEPIFPGSAYAPNPHVVVGTAGGDLDISTLGQTPLGACEGFAAASPNHIMTVERDLDWLAVAAEGGPSLQLVVESPDGWLCVAGDGRREGPRLEGPIRAGEYRLWVASGRAERAADYTLTFTTSAASTTTAPPSIPAVPLDTTATWGRHQSVSIAPGFAPDPITLTGTGGGSFDTRSLGYSPDGACVGFTEAQPSHVLTFSRPFDYLRLGVRSATDTTLLVYGPEGWRCSDDVNGSNPQLAGRFSAGTYLVWVGAGSPEGRQPYQLTVTQYDR